MPGALPDRSAFDPAAFLPRAWYDALVALRVHQPEAVAEEAATRARRRTLAPDGRLLILAADHPARMVTRAGAEPMAMGDRHALLARVTRVLTAPGVDGLMATPDVVDDVLLLSHLVRRRTGSGWLDDKIVIGCMNRGGLAGTVFELDDRMTAYTPEGLGAIRADGAKMMVRIDPEDPATAATLEACARAIDACHERDLTVFLEAFAVERTAGGVRPRTDADSLIKAAGVAAALGTSSARTWLKLPYGPGYERVAAATSLPILMLGGDVRDSVEAVLGEFAAGMQAGPAVRGILAGRNISFVAGEDPRAIAAAAGAIAHGERSERSARSEHGESGAALAAARRALAHERGRAFDLIAVLGPPPRPAGGPARP